MTKKFSKRGIAVRMLLLVLIPMFWGLLFYFAGRPADVRTRNGITITMEEPFGSWRYDERLAKDCPIWPTVFGPPSQATWSTASAPPISTPSCRNR